MPVTTLPMTIPANQALSGPLQIGLLKVVRLAAPSDWTPAALTFQISLDDAGTTWLDLHRAAESNTGLWTAFETGISKVIPNSILLLPADVDVNVPWLKLRSGTRSQPFNQSADRTFTIVFGD